MLSAHHRCCSSWHHRKFLIHRTSFFFGTLWCKRYSTCACRMSTKTSTEFICTVFICHIHGVIIWVIISDSRDLREFQILTHVACFKTRILQVFYGTSVDFNFLIVIWSNNAVLNFLFFHLLAQSIFDLFLLCFNAFKLLG